MKTRKLILLFGICLTVIADYLLLMDTSEYSFYWRFPVYAFVIITSYSVGIIYQKKIQKANARLQPIQFVIVRTEGSNTHFVQSYTAFKFSFMPSIYDAYYFPDHYHAEMILQSISTDQSEAIKYFILKIN